MDRLKPLKALNLDGNLLQNWKSWKQDFNLFMAFNFSTTADLMK